MNAFYNSKKDKFLASIPRASIELESDNLTIKCKFNFAYFTKQAAGQSFEEWDRLQLTKFLDKLKDYSQQPLVHWMNQRIGSKNGRVLSLYDEFPKHSEFTHPDHVPHQARWGRFRLESAARLIGFVLPGTFADKAHPKTGVRFDCNTFYVVFLDANHKFYKTETK